MEYALVAIVSFLASVVTFYAGFGIATIVMPVLSFFMPVPLAIGMTAVVHLLHCALKGSLLWRSIDWKIVLRFGLTAGFFAIFGALLLYGLSGLTPFYSYKLGFVRGNISLLHLSLGLLLIAIATMEVTNRPLRVSNPYLGGAISGFFGGLSGNQGAFRSAFLVQENLSKEAFIGTSALIAMVVDATRIVVYGATFKGFLGSSHMSLLWPAIGGASLGVFVGMFLLPKVTIGLIRQVIVVMLYLFGALFVAGVIGARKGFSSLVFRFYSL